MHALERVDTGGLSRATLARVGRLRAAPATGRRGPYARVDGGAGVAAANYARREPLAAIDSTGPRRSGPGHGTANADLDLALVTRDRKSTRLNSSHSQISYAVFCLKKKDNDVLERDQPLTCEHV